MRTPNPEQKLAIEHLGGMILNAGAGSGKTFVLVEHLIYLTEKFLEDNKKKSGEELARSLAKFFSKMVFMTFTKKAAGELAGRIKKAFAKKSEDSRWELAESQISHLFVGTIHAFCSKLLSQGYVTEIGPELNLLTDLEQSEKINYMVKDFYEKVGKNLEISDVFLANLEEIAKGFKFIFNSVELRKKWRGWNPKDTSFLSFQSFMDEVIKLNDWQIFNDIKPSDFKDFSGRPWATNILNFLNVFNLKKFKNYEVVKDYLEFFAGISRLNKPTAKDDCPLGVEIITKMGDLKKFLKENDERFSAYFENPKAVEIYALSVKKLFDHIESQIPYHNGLVFSDLEYYVLKGLENPSLAKRVRDNYSYFVVDEFQDTSKGQSEIIELLTGQRTERLFCVGDLQQAIYGFRGGDLEVFLDHLKKMPIRRKLVNNYRSKKSLINFNNTFFDHVFNTSFDFTQIKRSDIPNSFQNFPDDSENIGEGEVNRLHIKGDFGGKLDEHEINHIEALGILDLIKLIQSNHPEEEICVLYRNRLPSWLLINKLLAEKLEFKAQIHILEKSDPVIAILEALLEAQLLFFSGEDYLSQLQILINSILDYLNILNPKNLDELFIQYIKDQKIIGMEEALKKFFFALNISNSNHSNNFSNMNSMIRMSGDNPERILGYLDSNKKSGYSFEFQIGKGKNLIKIMTVHASKGLEFDHVILGGIHTNEVERGGTSPIFGKNPGAFQWKKESKDKKTLKTPQYYLEDENTWIKVGFESKRLLYVACTRAKNSLSFVDIGKQVKGSRSWINAFRFFTKDNLFKTFEKTQSSFEIPSKEIKRPLFHRDDLGIILKKDCDGPSFLGTLGDISVTSLAPLSECPRKFYLKNVCRLDDNNFAQQFDEEEMPVLSSSERGSKIHFEISRRLIQKDFSNHPDSPIQFALNYLGKLKDDYEIISEKLFKFPVFGYMCSGIPDVLLLPLKDSPFLILDFKTGAKNEISHLFQLYVYAYGVYQLGMLDKEKEIKVILLYLDLKEIVEFTIDFQKTTQEVFKVWKNLYNLDQVNLNHCKECTFHGLCYSPVATP